MIPNALTVLIGLWLAYSAIFSSPAGDVNNIQLAIAGVVVAACAIIARRTDGMVWHSNTNVTLGIVLALLAAARAWHGLSSPASFWIVLLAGIAAATAALWSMLYRSDTAQAEPTL
jgi:hypothetical protein